MWLKSVTKYRLFVFHIFIHSLSKIFDRDFYVYEVFSLVNIQVLYG